ncbi:MAG TPA: hypothetical protein VK813_14145 [Edaphobacter sp.]|nr:hypothetical protein [Edaphobacter sp.]
MRFPADVDLVVFLYVTGKILLTALPNLRQSAPHVPISYEIKNVPEASLTEAQARYFAPYDEKLAAMNYRPVCTYLIGNYGKNLTRHYLNPAERSRCEVAIHELALTVEGRQAFTSSCVIHFHTRFTDDRVLTTRNMKLKNILDNPPYWVLQECPQIDDPAKLKRIHDARAQTMGCPVAPPTDVDRILRDVQSEHQRYSAYQLSVGGYRPVPGEDSYALSDKVHWRGVRNYFNPFAQGISARLFFPVAILAAALPVFARLEYAPAAAHAAHFSRPPSRIRCPGHTPALLHRCGISHRLLLRTRNFPLGLPADLHPGPPLHQRQPGPHSLQRSRRRRSLVRSPVQETPPRRPDPPNRSLIRAKAFPL